MPFRFRLGALLRLRQSAERAARQRLAEVTQRRAAVVRESELLARGWLAGRGELVKAMQEGLTAGELHRAGLEDALHRNRIAVLATQQSGLDRQRDAQQAAYIRARAGALLLEKLRAARLADYSRLEARRTQAELDDLSLSRVTRRTGVSL